MYATLRNDHIIFNKQNFIGKKDGMISEYYEIRRLSKFHLSSNYRVDLAEQILGKMFIH